MKLKMKPTTSASILLVALFSLAAPWNIIIASKKGLLNLPPLSAIVIQLLILALPAVFYCTLRGKEFREGLRINFFPLSAIILIVSASFLIISGGVLIGAGMNALFPEQFKASNETAAGTADSFYLLITLAVVPAITEEVLFRGIMLTEFTEKGVFCAVTVSSLAFAMSHFSFVRFPVYLFCGLVLALVTFAARSLIASVIVHLINNTVVLFFEENVIKMTERQNVSSVLILFILAVVFFISAIVTAFEASSLYKSYGKANRDSSYLPDRKKRGSLLRAFSESVFSPAFLIAVVIFAVVSFIIINLGGNVNP